MTDPQHKGGWTPGPWQVRDEYTREGPLTIIANIDGEYDSEGRASCTYDTVAICEDEFGDVLRDAHSNARLIAAAPELYEALTGLLRLEIEWGDPTGREWDKARAALAKASPDKSGGA